MSKRRISKQQSARIKKIQHLYQQDQPDNPSNLADGLVITRFRKHVILEDNQQNRIHCSIRPNLDTVVAGDRVVWQPEGEKQGVVVSIYPRASMLARPTAKGIQKPVAANITQMIIVIAPQPEVSWPLLDSYLIMAETLQLHAVLVMNKTDLLSEECKQEFLSIYLPLEYPIIFTTQADEQSYDPLTQVLNHQVSVFVGQSGVGKSSLIATILPHEQDIATSSISESALLGRHTTSNSRYYHLPTGGALIDSPGVREFSLWNMDLYSIAKGYKEFLPFISQCKFRNCQHVNTPHCGLIQALENGLIAQRRYENFIKLCTQFTFSK